MKRCVSCWRFIHPKDTRCACEIVPDRNYDRTAELNAIKEAEEQLAAVEASKHSKRGK